MNRVNGIFCYNRVLLHGRWHLPAFSCSMSAVEDTVLYDHWVQVTECRSGRRFTIRELLSESIPADFPEELVRLDKSVDLSQFALDDRGSVSVSQHCSYIITDTDLSDIPMPCFFSTEHSDLSAFRATATLSDYLLCDLPEQIAYRKRCLEFDKKDYVMFGIGVGRKIRPPLGVWFPMAVEGTAGVYPGVFRINEMQGQHSAEIEGFVAATPADIQVGGRISRTYEGHKCDIGVISQLREIELLR